MWQGAHRNMVGQKVLISLGGNKTSRIGGPAATTVFGIHRLRELSLGAMRISPLYVTPAFPAGAGPDFVNAAVMFVSDLTAPDLLAALHLIEAAAGRSRAARWGERTLDLDLIALDDEIWPDAATQDQWRNLAPEAQTSVAPDQLILPHPRLQDRSFVLVPLADIAPDWRHPRLGQSVVQMLDRLPAADRASVVKLDPQPVVG